MWRAAVQAGNDSVAGCSCNNLCLWLQWTQEGGVSVPGSPHARISPDLVDLSPITSPSSRSLASPHASPFGSPPQASRPQSMQDLVKVMAISCIISAAGDLPCVCAKLHHAAQLAGRVLSQLADVDESDEKLPGQAEQASESKASAAAPAQASCGSRPDSVWSPRQQQPALATGNAQAQQLAMSTPVDVKALNFAVDQLIIVGESHPSQDESGKVSQMKIT